MDLSGVLIVIGSVLSMVVLPWVLCSDHTKIVTFNGTNYRVEWSMDETIITTLKHPDLRMFKRHSLTYWRIEEIKPREYFGKDYILLEEVSIFGQRKALKYFDNYIFEQKISLQFFDGDKLLDKYIRGE